uniref:Leucine-rich repeat-containing protein 51 n=1 Tax=Petromyzon marinus TaxID=7757 RepID=A0AAJ7X322_PETMA|nr:leucine-rich repeat-containing protein 51 isoform X2 [Petromyzon marinus]
MSDAMSAAATTQRDLLTEDPRSMPAEAKARNANAVKAPSQHKTEDAIMAASGTTSMHVAKVVPLGLLGYASVAPSTDTAQSEHKYDVTALRLNNNALTNLEGFWETTAALIQQPSALAWIDLSFNQLSDIPQVLCELQELRVLYLHGNTVSRLSNVSTLVPLRHLRSLTLHGNPIETENHYRYYVLSALPSLKSLDFSAVTNQDRQTAVIWSMNRARHSKRKLRDQQD